MRRLLITTTILLAMGCAGEESVSPSDEGADASSDSPDSPWTIEMPAEFEVFGDMAAVWQGSWVVRHQSRMQAWQVSDRTVTTFDGTEEQSHTLEFFGPCKAALMTSNGQGIISTQRGFTVVGEALLLPLRSSSLWDGEHFAACISGDLVYYDGDSCLFFEGLLPKKNTWSWGREEAECEIKESTPGIQTLHYKTASMTKAKSAGRLYESVEQLSDEDRERNMAQRFDDFDAAKAGL